MTEPEFDADGYPTETTLKLIENWPHANFVELMEFVGKAWRFPDFFRAFSKDGRYVSAFEISTGGWSCNEDLIRAMQANVVFWACCWESSRRGGHYTFDVKRLPN